MCHLVTYNGSYGTVVDGVVRLWIEEWRLQYACGEAYLVGSRIIVSVDCLWRHQPFRLVDRLAHLAVEFVDKEVFAYVCKVLVERERIVDHKLGVIPPLVGIANLHYEVFEFVLRLSFCGVAHPCCLADTLSECRLQVAYNLRHTFLARLGEIFLAIHLTYGVAEHTVYKAVGTLPSWHVLLLSAQLAVELKVCLAEIVGQCACRTAYKTRLGV